MTDTPQHNTEEAKIDAILTDFMGFPPFPPELHLAKAQLQQLLREARKQELRGIGEAGWSDDEDLAQYLDDRIAQLSKEERS